VGNLIQPGDRVDVLVYLKSNFNGGTQQAGTTTILQDIKVFAVNDQWRPGDSGDGEPIPVKNVTLLLTPEQVEKLTLASELGKVSLVLRSPDDELTAGVGKGTTSKDLFGTADGSNKDRERDFLAQSGKTETTPSGGLLGMLGVGKGNNSAPTLAAVTPADVERFTMELIEGPQARTVEFTRTTGGNTKWHVSTAAETTGGAPPTAEPTFKLPQAGNPTSGVLPPLGPLPGDAGPLGPAEQD
jgi:pilus assembly protein CpaB